MRWRTTVTDLILLLRTFRHAFGGTAGVVAGLPVSALIVEDAAANDGLGAELRLEIAVVEVHVMRTRSDGNH